MKFVQKTCLSAAAALLVCSLPTQAATPSNEELYRIIQQQNQRIESLENDLRKERGAAEAPNQQALESKVKAQQEQINALADRQEKPSKLDKVSIGGYGELHYNNLDADDKSRDLDQLDFHRFVLFFRLSIPRCLCIGKQGAGKYVIRFSRGNLMALA